MKPNSKPGLTLIELLTILAIIFILATILIPTHSGHRAQAWKALDASNLRQIGQAALIYGLTTMAVSCRD